MTKNKHSKQINVCFPSQGPQNGVRAAIPFPRLSFSNQIPFPCTLPCPTALFPALSGTSLGPGDTGVWGHLCHRLSHTLLHGPSFHVYNSGKCYGLTLSLSPGISHNWATKTCPCLVISCKPWDHSSTLPSFQLNALFFYQALIQIKWST